MILLCYKVAVYKMWAVWFISQGFWCLSLLKEAFVMSDSLQCLAELWRRLFWELLKTPERQRNHWSQPRQVHKEKVLFNELNLPLWWVYSPGWPREDSWCNLLEFQRSFQYCFSQYPSGKSVQHTARQKHNAVGEQLADGSGSKGYCKWGYIKLMTSPVGVS